MRLILRKKTGKTYSKGSRPNRQKAEEHKGLRIYEKCIYAHRKIHAEKHALSGWRLQHTRPLRLTIYEPLACVQVYKQNRKYEFQKLCEQLPSNIRTGIDAKGPQGETLPDSFPFWIQFDTVFQQFL